MNMKKNKISKVWIEHKIDESPDTSWLGEYTNEPSGWHVDRKAGQLLASNGDILAADVPGDYSRGEYQYISGFQHTGSLKSWASQTEKSIASAWLRIRYQANGREQGLRGNLFQHFGVVGWQNANTRAEKVRCIDVVYCCLEALRLHRLERNDWCFLGIIAKAEIISPAGIIQTVRSGGLWGVESDSDKSYLNDVEKEELHSLRAELETMGDGFGVRSMDYAFKNVERINP